MSNFHNHYKNSSIYKHLNSKKEIQEVDTHSFIEKPHIYVEKNATISKFCEIPPVESAAPSTKSVYTYKFSPKNWIIKRLWLKSSGTLALWGGTAGALNSMGQNGLFKSHKFEYDGNDLYSFNRRELFYYKYGYKSTEERLILDKLFNYNNTTMHNTACDVEISPLITIWDENIGFPLYLIQEEKFFLVCSTVDNVGEYGTTTGGTVALPTSAPKLLIEYIDLGKELHKNLQNQILEIPVILPEEELIGNTATTGSIVNLGNNVKIKRTFSTKGFLVYGITTANIENVFASNMQNGNVFKTISINSCSGELIKEFSSESYKLSLIESSESKKDLSIFSNILAFHFDDELDESSTISFLFDLSQEDYQSTCNVNISAGTITAYYLFYTYRILQLQKGKNIILNK